MIAIAPTDLDWFLQLRDDLHPKQINFWTPTPWNPKRLKEGNKFFFLLKAPYRKIGGFGYFSYYENLTTYEAWNRFGKGNGVKSLFELNARAIKYASKRSNNFEMNDNPIIGCIVLKNPVFFDEDDYFKPEEYGLSFAKEVVKLKYFDIDDIEISEPYKQRNLFELVSEDESEYRVNKIKDRSNQSKFRQKLLNYYDYKCAISGESCLEILEAAHIQQYINGDSNHIQNGIILRVDLHKLYDAGLLTIDNNYKVVLSPYLESEYYQIYNGKTINLPNDEDLKPSLEALNYHNKYVFRK